MTAADEEATVPQTGWPGLRARLFHTLFLLRRPMTLGVRALIHDKEKGEVFLIRHTYVPGWQLPGGGVETGETAADALAREVLEECAIELTGAAELRSVYFNRQASRRDHVLFYLVTDYRVVSNKQPDREIAEARFFTVDELPRDTTAATRRRLAEVFGGRKTSPYW